MVNFLLKIKHLSLLAKIFTLSIGSVIITGITSLILAKSNFNQQEEFLKGKLSLATQDLSNAIQDQFYDRYTDIRMFSQHFKNLNYPQNESTAYLNQIIKLYKIYDLITVCDLNGRLIAVNNIGKNGSYINSDLFYKINFLKLKWVQETIENKYLEDKTKNLENVNFQDAQFDTQLESILKENVYTSIYSTLIYNSKNEPIGVISAHANFAWVENIIKRLYADFSKSGLKTLEINVLDKKGFLLLDYNPMLNNGKTEVKHNEKVLNKYNLFTSNNFSGEEGVIEALHSRRKVMQIKAFKNIAGNKIVDSLGWKIIVKMDSSEFFADIYRGEIIYLLSFILIMILVILISYIFSSQLSKSLSVVANSLTLGNQLLYKTSEETSAESQKLSEAAINQSDSLQKTVSAVNEINSMISKTKEMTVISQEKAGENKVIVNQGKEIVHKMLKSIENIKSSNENVYQEVMQGNNRISEIVKLISEIENKTKIINTIVFQTKLLSFNASVEAARAGENGRGFAVVAEEVGNLAQMSGSASKDISVMLKASIEKVKSIIAETKQNIDNILESSKSAMQSGEKVSSDCSKIFENIYEKTEEFATIVNEIANSTKEQAKGISEINVAMNELDSVTNNNTAIAKKSAENATELLKQSYEIEKMSNYLLAIISGKNN
ncbi:methyl-accepting chemotaxis protein [Fluviispira vulneris]|uniref:methyl-accepting chemotaxis protein n=1 Tax=Fluviispira vulneris TaxID=2763012 RepID=UPI0016455219|nr:methyl-accepting chemotaxis protein [Fluviispira vulneris]